MKNKFQYIFRVAVCLVLVCCLITNIAVIPKAHASALGTLYQIAGNIGANAALRAIGVGPGNSPDAYNTLVTNIADALAPVNNFMTNVLIAGTSGNWLTYLKHTFLQSILDYMLDSGTLVSSSSKSTDFSFTCGTNSYTVSCDVPISVVVCKSNPLGSGYFYRCIALTSEGGVLTVNGNIQTWTRYNDYAYYQIGNFGGPKEEFLTSLPIVDCGSSSTTSDYIPYIISYISSDSISTNEDLTLDAVAPSLDDDPYIPWVENSIFNDGEKYVPVSLPSQDSSIISSQTQAQAQAGTATDAVVDEIIAGSETVPDSGTVVEGLTGSLSETKAETFLDSIFEFFAELFAPITEFFTNFWAFAEYLIDCLEITLPDKIINKLEDVKTFFGSIPETLSGMWETVKAVPDACADAFAYFFECLQEGIEVLPQAIAKAIADVFIPSQAYIQTKVEELLVSFPFIGSIIETGTYIRDSLFASGPPVIYVDLSAADGDIDYGEKTLLTDFSWYAPYKGTVDSVLGAALWAFFGWRVFLRLPGLISGAEGYVGEFRTRYDAYSKKRKEE